MHHCRTRLDWRLILLAVAVAAQSRIRRKSKITAPENMSDKLYQ